MKKVFTNSREVLKLWTKQSQSEARCKNVFFVGDTVYSYGYHYELGRIVTFNGIKVALINDSGYSVTTSKHISWARFAASSVGIVQLNWSGPLVADAVELAMVRLQGEIMDSLFDHFARRKFWSGYTFIDSYLFKAVLTFNHYCEILKLTHLKLDFAKNGYVELFNEHVEKCLKREQELKQEKIEAKARQELVNPVKETPMFTTTTVVELFKS